MSLMVIWMALLLVSFTEARRKWDKIDPEVSLFYPGAHYIMLTFHDDGVTAKETYGTYMNQLLDILEKRKARVTFFVQGTNVEKYPDYYYPKSFKTNYIMKRYNWEGHPILPEIII